MRELANPVCGLPLKIGREVLAASEFLWTMTWISLTYCKGDAKAVAAMRMWTVAGELAGW